MKLRFNNRSGSPAYKVLLFYVGILAILVSCSPASLPTASTYDYPTPVDTETKPILPQTKKDFNLGKEVSATNNFDGARLNDFQEINHNTFRAIIRPENQPINDSPWYAFKIWALEKKLIQLQLDYGSFQHRYPPKLSMDGLNWEPLDSIKVSLNPDSTLATLRIEVDTDTLWIAAQELITSIHVSDWCHQLAKKQSVRTKSIGTSQEGRPMMQMDVYLGQPKKKPIIVILSRQHPPEVTGFMALEAFLERIIDGSTGSNEFLNQYRLLVYPLMNPDGVDNGHWRHNAGGVDLNRDWAYYHQKETRVVADQVAAMASQSKSKVIIGLDFHSTWYDVYYTSKTDSSTTLPNFTRQWLSGIEKAIPGYHVNEQPSGLGRPVSKAWFFTQFNAVGITYEIGDNTPRKFVRHKGEVSAEQLMQILTQNTD